MLLHLLLFACKPATSVDGDGDGYIEDDCDDGDASIHPGAWDLGLDGVDADCSGEDGGTLKHADLPWLFTVLEGDADFGTAFELCDLNDDGQDDLVWLVPRAGSGARIGVMPGPLERGQRVLEPAFEFDLSGELVADFACGDVDGDGRTDVVTQRAAVGSVRAGFSIFYQPADGFPERTVSLDAARVGVYTVDHETHSIHVSDADGDGRAEVSLSMTREIDYVDLYVFDGGLLSSTSHDIDHVGRRIETGSWASTYETQALGDLDGDGDIELTVCGDQLPACVLVDDLTADDLSTHRLAALDLSSGGRVALGDFDGDGDSDDLAIRPWNNDSTVRVRLDALEEAPLIRMEGLGTSEVVVPEGRGGFLRNVGDRDGDGADDLALTLRRTLDPGVEMRLLSGALAADPVRPIVAANTLLEIEELRGARYQQRAGDLDGDGVLDLFFSTGSSEWSGAIGGF